MALTDTDSARSSLSPAGLIGRARAWLADASHRSIAQRVAGTAFIIRVASAALIYICQIFLARWMGRFEFGIYVYVWTWVLLLGGLAPLGIGYLAQRFIPEYTGKSDGDGLRGFIVGSRWLCFGFGAAAAAVGIAVVVLYRGLIPAHFFWPFVLGFACLPIFAVSCVQDSIARSYNWIDLALVPAYIAQPILIFGVMAALYGAGVPATAVAAVLTATAGFWAVVLLQLVLLNRRIARTVEPGPRRYEFRYWLRAGLPVLMIDGFYFLLTYTDILLLQLYVGPEQIAVYYAATKTLALVAFIYFAVSAASAHRFSEYHVAGDRTKLADFVADATRWTFWPSLAMTVALVALGKPILMLFGEGFAEGYPLILVMACGLLARASIGPAERLLNMVGQQKLCALVYAGAFAINLVLCLLTIPHLGMHGAAISTATALIAETALLFWVARRRLGIHVFIWGRPAAA